MFNKTEKELIKKIMDNFTFKYSDLDVVLKIKEAMNDIDNINKQQASMIWSCISNANHLHSLLSKLKGVIDGTTSGDNKQ